MVRFIGGLGDAGKANKPESCINMKLRIYFKLSRASDIWKGRVKISKTKVVVLVCYGCHTTK